jgi:hypothetical protein
MKRKCKICGTDLPSPKSWLSDWCRKCCIQFEGVTGLALASSIVKFDGAEWAASRARADERRREAWRRVGCK